MRRASLLATCLLGCASGADTGRDTLAFRAACPADAVWDGHACVAQAAARAEVATAAKALEALDVETAKATLERVATTAPLEHATNVRLWEQRGIASAYLDDVPAARAA